VELRRADFTWLLRRNFRAGQSHGSRLRRQRRVLANIFLAVAKAGVCTLGAAVNLTNASRRSRYLIRAALHCGVVARLSGIGEIRMY
jgi:succinoglycan biosynthesis protein ExoM